MEGYFSTEFRADFMLITFLRCLFLELEEDPSPAKSLIMVLMIKRLPK